MTIAGLAALHTLHKIFESVSLVDIHDHDISLIWVLLDQTAAKDHMQRAILAESASNMSNLVADVEIGYMPVMILPALEECSPVSVEVGSYRSMKFANEIADTACGLALQELVEQTTGRTGKKLPPELADMVGADVVADRLHELAVGLVGDCANVAVASVVELVLLARGVGDVTRLTRNELDRLNGRAENGGAGCQPGNDCKEMHAEGFVMWWVGGNLEGFLILCECVCEVEETSRLEGADALFTLSAVYSHLIRLSHLPGYCH